VTQDHTMQVGLVKKYSDAEAVSGLLNLVKMELGLGTDVGFTQVRQRKENRKEGLHTGKKKQRKQKRRASFK